jgi:transposase
MGWMAPLRHRRARLVFLENHQEREPSMSEITTIGLDLAKHVFQVHGIDARGTTVLRKRLRRGQVLAFFSRIPRCVVGLEACATAHYWARELGALGHEVRLMPAQYVKAYIKRNKHDAADAEAICEAVQRPTMRFVPVKTAEQQATQLLHRGREQLVRQRTMLVNALRAHLAEFGMVAAQGLRNVGQLIAIVRADGDTRLPDVARQVLQVLANQIEQIETAITALERQLLTWHKSNAVSQRLTSIPGIGPIIATAIATTVADPKGVPLGPRVRRLAGLGAAAEFNRRENPAGRDHQARQPLSAPAAHQRGKRQSAAIEGDQSRSMGDRAPSAAAAAGRSRGAGEQDGAHRLGGDAARERIPAQGCGGLVVHGTGAGACERAMTRDGTVGRSDATERSLPFHWDVDPARMMRPRFADSIRASSPAGLREQAGHMTASDFCAARYISSCQAGAIHT